MRNGACASWAAALAGAQRKASAPQTALANVALVTTEILGRSRSCSHRELAPRAFRIGEGSWLTSALEEGRVRPGEGILMRSRPDEDGRAHTRHGVELLGERHRQPDAAVRRG